MQFPSKSHLVCDVTPYPCLGGRGVTLPGKPPKAKGAVGCVPDNQPVIPTLLNSCNFAFSEPQVPTPQGTLSKIRRVKPLEIGLEI